MIRLRFFFAWYDFWIGAFFDRRLGVLFVCLIPCCVIEISRNCDWCRKTSSVTNLDGDYLCQGCANDWVRGEGIAALQYDDSEELF